MARTDSLARKGDPSPGQQTEVPRERGLVEAATQHIEEENTRLSNIAAQLEIHLDQLIGPDPQDNPDSEAPPPPAGFIYEIEERILWVRNNISQIEKQVDRLAKV